MNVDAEMLKSSRVKACDHCRQNKLRCDASRDTSAPCSRCRGRGLNKSELQAEIDALKHQVHSPHHVAATSPVSLHHSQSSLSQPSLSGPSNVPAIQHSTTPIPSMPPPSNLSAYPSLPPPSMTPVNGTVPPNTAPTSPRTLDGVTVGTKVIEDCFALFADKYLPQLPVLESLVRPNFCYQQSQLLFWTIVAIGSRKYAQDPTLLTLLSTPVTNLAKATSLSRETPIPVIQSLLLLCMWPMPTDSLSKEITTMLSGIIIEHALMIGLHIFGVGQDFSRVKVAWDRAQIGIRARLWALVIATCQRVNSTDGIPPPSVPDNYDHDYCRSQALNALTPSIGFQKTLSQIQTDAILETQRFALSKRPENRAAALGPILDTVTDQLIRLNSSVTCEIDRLFLVCGQLQIQTFHLFAPSASIQDSRLTQMYDLACSAVEIAVTLDKATGYAEHAPVPVSKYLILAACTILKMTRSRINGALDLSRGQTAYFAVIQFHRKMSLQNYDTSARATSILTQLWTSRTVFKESDGTVDSLTIRCGSRLAMSVVFDLYWWWRQEFAGLPNPYENGTGGASGSATISTKVPMVAPQMDSQLLGLDFWSWQDNFPEFAWPSQQDLTPGGWFSIGQVDGTFSQIPGTDMPAVWM